MLYPFLTYSYIGLLALHVVVGSVFFVHGTNKFSMWKMQPSEQMPKGMLTVMRILSIAETLGGIAVFFGFLTQLAAIGLMIVMLGAIYFKVFKWKTPFTAHDTVGWEFDLTLLAACLVLLTAGAGTISLDWWWF